MASSGADVTPTIRRWTLFRKYGIEVEEPADRTTRYRLIVRIVLKGFSRLKWVRTSRAIHRQIVRPCKRSCLEIWPRKILHWDVFWADHGVVCWFPPSRHGLQNQPTLPVFSLLVAANGNRMKLNTLFNVGSIAASFYNASIRQFEALFPTLTTLPLTYDKHWTRASSWDNVTFLLDPCSKLYSITVKITPSRFWPDFPDFDRPYKIEI